MNVISESSDDQSSQSVGDLVLVIIRFLYKVKNVQRDCFIIKNAFFL